GAAGLAERVGTDERDGQEGEILQRLHAGGAAAARLGEGTKHLGKLTVGRDRAAHSNLLSYGTRLVTVKNFPLRHVTATRACGTGAAKGGKLFRTGHGRQGTFGWRRTVERF